MVTFIHPTIFLLTPKLQQPAAVNLPFPEMEDTKTERPWVKIFKISALRRGGVQPRPEGAQRAALLGIPAIGGGRPRCSVPRELQFSGK